MSATETSLRSLYASVGEDLQRNGLIGPLQRLCSDVSEKLETLPDGAFAKAWILECLVSELLKYSIEDDYVSIEDIRSAVARHVRELLATDDWIYPKLREAIQALRAVAQKPALRATPVEIHAVTAKDSCLFSGMLAKPKSPLIQVSTRQYAMVPILEDSLTNPRYSQGVVDAFAERLSLLRQEERISCLCFIEKAVGPVGAVSMVSALVSRLNLPACIYRAGHWPARTKLAGYQPKATDRVALVYDLLVTGDGLRQAAQDLEARFGAAVSAALVLFGYQKKTNTLRITGDREIRIEAIGWYDGFAAEVDQLFANENAKTPNIKVLPNGRRTSRSPASSRRASPPPRGSKEVEMERSPKWNRLITSYPHSELRALKFRSKRDFERAIRLCWMDDELKGVPRESPDGVTLIVPKEAVSCFDTKGLRFSVSTLITPEEISSRDLAGMRRKYGM